MDRLTTRELHLTLVIRAFPLAFLLHDLEEIFTMPRFWQGNRDRLPLPVALKDRVEITTPQVTIAVLYEFLITLMISQAAARSLRPGRALRLFTAAVAVLFLNVFTHLGQALLMRGYTPGVLTAPLISLPYSLYTFRRLFQARLLDRRSFTGAMISGAALALPLVLSAHALGLLITKWWDPKTACARRSTDIPR